LYFRIKKRNKIMNKIYQISLFFNLLPFTSYWKTNAAAHHASKFHSIALISIQFLDLSARLVDDRNFFNLLKRMLRSTVETVLNAFKDCPFNTDIFNDHFKLAHTQYILENTLYKENYIRKLFWKKIYSMQLVLQRVDFLPEWRNL